MDATPATTPPANSDYPEHFSDGTSRCDDIFTHKNAFPLGDRETAAVASRHCTPSANIDLTLLAGDFLPDDNPAERRSDDGIDLTSAHVRGDFGAEAFCLIGILQNFGALKIIGTVQAGGELKMPFKERVRLPEEF
jgi:hypothetical protein